MVVRAVGGGQGGPHHCQQALGSAQSWRLRTQGDLNARERQKLTDSESGKKMGNILISVSDPDPDPVPDPEA